MCSGIQSKGVASTVKHYAAYSVPKGGRDGACRTDPHITPRELHEIFLYPFKRVFREAHPLGVMASYNDWNGEPVAASRWFLTDLLRNEYGFDGYVVSDSLAVEFVQTKHAVAETYDDAVKQVLEAGLNVRTEFTPPEDFILPVRRGVASGGLSRETLDTRVGEVLSVKFRLGLFDNPYIGDLDIADEKAGWEKHLDFADALQAESFVLLKNANGILPLDAAKLGKILVAGPLADERNYMTSRYGPNGIPGKTILDGIRDYLDGKAEVAYAKGCETVDVAWPDSEIVPRPLDGRETGQLDEAVKAAESCDLVVAVLGEDENTCGESRSRTSLDLMGRQQLLLERLCATGKPVVVVLVNGQPLTVNWADRYAAAILEAWFPGPRGGVAVAKTLFGELNPSGKLTVTFPKSVGQIEYNFPFKKGSHGGQPPWEENKSVITRVHGALYPFGYGLSYTKFEYSGMEVSSKKDGSFEVSCDVKNTGARDGAEVVQLYVRDLCSSVVTYDSVLRGFEKVWLEPSETRRVVFTVAPEDLAILDKNMRWTCEPGEFEFMLGASSEDIQLRKVVGVQTAADF
jgi:beta-glucosidase